MASLFDQMRDADEAHTPSEKRGADQSVLPLTTREEPQRGAKAEKPSPDSALALANDNVETSRALALTDVIAPRTNPGDALLRFAYRLGIPGHALAAPFRRPASPRVRATVESPVPGDRATGTALRAGHFLVHGVKIGIAQVDFDSTARPGSGLEQTLHGFTWLRDLGASAPREDCIGVAERITSRWLAAHPQPGKGPAWDLEYTGLRLLAWLVNAPLVLSGRDPKLKAKLLTAISETAHWLDRKAPRAPAGLGQVAGCAAITAAGLLMPNGKPRRLFGEAALIRALGDLVGEDGGVLSRCPDAQMQAIMLLTDLIACYEAAEIEAPQAFIVMRELLVPPLLALRHGDGGLGNWQGQGAIAPDRIAGLLAATGIRTRPLKAVGHWGFQRMRAGETIVQFDTAPPPRSRHARTGCASTLAFEMSDGPARLIVNCGGAAMAGGQVPARIGQGLRASAAHSTLVLDDTNSTAVQLHGQLGKGVEAVEVECEDLRLSPDRKVRDAARVSASHDGYAARFGLTHKRVLTLRGDGSELAGEDILLPVSRKGKRGKIGFAIRFHLGRGVEVQLSENRRGASLLTPDGRLWQFRMRGDAAGAGEVALRCEDSLWVDGDGRPHATFQLLIEGMTSRGGGQFSWLFKKMG